MAVNGKVNKNDNRTAKTKSTNFFKSLKAEFKRITWAPEKDVKKALGAVALCCSFYVFLISLCDLGFKNLFTMIFGR